MASKIAALQAKLGGGAMIMGGMRPGGVNPLKKKKKESANKPRELDNSALLDRATFNNENKKAKKKKEFDELYSEDNDDDVVFNQSIIYNHEDNDTKQQDDNEYDDDKNEASIPNDESPQKEEEEIKTDDATDDNKDDESVESLFEKLQSAESKSLLKKYLTKEIFDKLKDSKTSQGCDLKSCIKSGIDNLDSGIGVYASDADAYTVFSDLLNPIIMDYHKLDSLDNFSHPTQNFAFDDTFSADLDPENKFVISTRIRVARNIKGYPLRGGMSEEQTNDLEQKVKDILESFEDEDLKGKYYPLNNMDEETRKQLVEDHFLFKKGDRFLESAGINNFWPNGRGIFFNDNKTFLVWINEEDQLRIISMEQGANVKSVFGRLEKAVAAINEKLDFAYHEKLGYLTACPTNIGCGERASVHIKVPLTAQNKELFEDIANRNHLQIRGVNGEHSESKGGVYDVSNKRRLGITEWDGVKDLINGCKELIESETKLQKQANGDANENETQNEVEEEEKTKDAEPKKSFKLKSLINKIKSEERWDYDIKFDDDDEEEKNGVVATAVENFLSVAVDSKFKRGNSLVDILMEGPEKLFEKGADDEHKEEDTPKDEEESNKTDEEKDENEVSNEKAAEPNDEIQKEEESKKADEKDDVSKEEETEQEKETTAKEDDVKQPYFGKKSEKIVEVKEKKKKKKSKKQKDAKDAKEKQVNTKKKESNTPKNKGTKKKAKTPQSKTAKKADTKAPKVAKKPKAATAKKAKGANAGDLKEWMMTNNIYDKPLWSALIANDIDSSAALQKMTQDSFDKMARKFRVERFAKVKGKKKQSAIDKQLVDLEKAWRKMKRSKKGKKAKGKKKQKK